MNDTPGVWAYGAWRVLDRDVDAHVPTQYCGAYDQWLTFVEQMLPGVQAAPKVFWPSTKTRVAIQGQAAKQSLNGHTWVDCGGGGVDITPAIKGRFRILAEELGKAWYVARKDSKTGADLPGRGNFKTIFDTAVWTIHRQLYAGAPTVGAGLELLPPAGFAVDGTPIDLRVAVPEVDALRVKSFSKKIGAKVGIGHDGVLTVFDTTSMRSTSEVIMENGETLTVAEFLRDGRYTFDTKYRCQCMFRESSSLNGMLRKLKKGIVWHHDNGAGVTYWLVSPDWRFLCEQYVKADDQDQAAQVLADGLVWVSETEYKIRRKEICTLAGIATLEALDALRKSGEKYSPKEQEQRRQEREAEFDADATVRKHRRPKELTELRDGDEILKELFAHWHLFLAGNAATMATFFTEPSGKGGHVLDYRAFSLQAMKDFTAAFPLEYELPSGEKVRAPVVKVWLNSPRRSGIRKVVFEPGWPAMVGGHLNLWTGFAVTPIYDQTKCDLFLQHVWEVIADKDQEVFDYVMNWLAKRVKDIFNRKPGELLDRMKAFIALRGVQGTGKGLFELYVAALFGIHALITSRGDGMAANFNWQFANLAMILADEAFFAGDPKIHNALKSFLTEPVFSFEQKFKDPVSLSNHCAVIMSTNKTWVVPADVGDRRSCVLDVSECRKGDSAYFGALAKELHGDGPAALLGYLIKRDITGFNPEKVPQTAALQEQKLLTLSRDDPAIEWLQEALISGVFPFYEWDYAFGGSVRRVPREWSNAESVELDRSELGDSVREYANKTKKFHPPSNDSIGRTLRKAIGVSKREWSTGAVERHRVWRVPSLSVARVNFEHYLRTGSLPLDWRCE